MQGIFGVSLTWHCVAQGVQFALHVVGIEYIVHVRRTMRKSFKLLVSHTDRIIFYDVHVWPD